MSFEQEFMDRVSASVQITVLKRVIDLVENGLANATDVRDWAQKEIKRLEKRRAKK